MGRRGDGYGSEYHLHRYLRDYPDVFNAAVSEQAGVAASLIRWEDVPKSNGVEREFRAIEFLALIRPDLCDVWAEHWPTTGKPITWDAVGTAGSAWLLVEAKANHPEFCTNPSRASKPSLDRIAEILNETKRHVHVHRFFDWTGTYYQHANRLAVIRFLTRNQLDAHLVSVYFYGDAFPDGTPCPSSQDEWEELLEARRLTMGLPHDPHALAAYNHSIFLPALEG